MQLGHRFLDGVHIVIFDTSNSFHSGYIATIGSQRRHEASIDINVFDFTGFGVLFRYPGSNTIVRTKIDQQRMPWQKFQSTHMTVHAPQPPSLQPNLEPVSFMSSLKKESKVWFDRALLAISSGTRFPFTYKIGVVRNPADGKGEGFLVSHQK